VFQLDTDPSLDLVLSVVGKGVESCWAIKEAAGGTNVHRRLCISCLSIILVMGPQVKLAIPRKFPMAIPTVVLVPFFAVLCLIVLPVFGQSVHPEADQGVWRTVTPAPTKRTEVAVAALNGRIYVVGGFEEPSLGNFLNLAFIRIACICWCCHFKTPLCMRRRLDL